MRIGEGVGMMYALCVWLAVSGIFVILGIAAWNAKKAVRFWTVSQQIQVRDVKHYNRAVAEMWFVFAGIFAVIGLPVLAGQNSAWIVFTILGGMFWAIALMAVYMKIEKKYRIF